LSVGRLDGAFEPRALLQRFLRALLIAPEIRRGRLLF
jgi:hypothetical protein